MCLGRWLGLTCELGWGRKRPTMGRQLAAEQTRDYPDANYWHVVQRQERWRNTRRRKKRNDCGTLEQNRGGYRQELAVRESRLVKRKSMYGCDSIEAKTEQMQEELLDLLEWELISVRLYSRKPQEGLGRWMPHQSNFL